MSDSFDAVVGDALTTVRIVPRWTLAGPHWDVVAAALRELADAIASADPRQVIGASERLDSLYPPTRLSAIPHGPAGSTEREPPPPGVMELVNTLIHPTGGWSGGAGSASDSSTSR